MAVFHNYRVISAKINIRGNSKFIHDKLYEGIVMYLDEQKNICYIRILKLKIRKKHLRPNRPEDVVEVPGYFLNDWNQMVNPSTKWKQFVQTEACVPTKMRLCV